MLHDTVDEWARRWDIPPEAVNDLRSQLGALSDNTTTSSGLSEAAVQSIIRAEASRKGLRLWRNNVGAFKDPNTGRQVRYGLCNDSTRMNRRIKSSDLIGIRPITIGPDHVGKVIGQFVARETKGSGWVFTGRDREVAQRRFLELLASFGADAKFAEREGTL